jgi:hypothetical protein
MKFLIIFLISTILVSAQLYAQDTTAVKKDIDPSKPTNLYTQASSNIEYQASKTQNLIGMRAIIQYAFNPDNLLLLEVPFLNNDRTNKFGLSDTRIRYFNAIKRNISPSFIAIAPFADISIPTGSFKNGLGSSSWSLAGGVVFGFIVSKRMSLFPGINYVHITKPATTLLTQSLKFSSDGVGLQFNASYVINKKTFLFINPTPRFLITNGKWQDIGSAEFNLNRIIKPNKFKMNVSFNPNFTYSIYSVRMGSTFFL